MTRLKNLRACSSVFLGIGEFLNTDDALEVASGRVNCDGTYFHLSFDDGLECLARNAVEPLLRLNIPSLVFINSSMAGEPSVEEREAWVRNTNYKKTLQTMSWQSLRDSGFEVGAHTRTHVRLSHVALQAELEREIVGCKEEIESNLGLRCDYFAWPYGSLDDFSTAAMLCVKEGGGIELALEHSGPGSYRELPTCMRFLDTISKHIGRSKRFERLRT